MNTPQSSPFHGAALVFGALVLAIVGVSTNYWFLPDANTHNGLWVSCNNTDCNHPASSGRAAPVAITALITMGIASIVTVITGIARSKSDANSNLARLCGVVSIFLLFSSGILADSSIQAYIAATTTIGFSYNLMVAAQYLSFLAAISVSYWMGRAFPASS